MTCLKLTTTTPDHCAEHCPERPQQAICVDFEQTEYDIRQINVFPANGL